MAGSLRCALAKTARTVRAWALRPPKDPDTIMAVCILATLTVALEGGGGQGRATCEGNCPERRDAGPLCGGVGETRWFIS